MRIVDADVLITELGYPYLRELASFGALPDEFIASLLHNGVITELQQGEFIARHDERAVDFQIILKGKIAFYKRGTDHDVLTRYFSAGEQSGFDLMIGLIAHNGTDVAVEDSLILDITNTQFQTLQLEHPEWFGILMINLSRELSREIEMLEELITRSTGWLL
jgi:CRP-like cAMP-binding protein